jgi:sugar phosphate isomerase/epimerase
VDDRQALTRRDVCGAWAAALLPALSNLARAKAPEKCGMGVVEHSFPNRLAVERAGGQRSSIRDPLAFLDHARALGTGGIQLALGARDEQEAAAIRERAESYGMYVEGSVRTPSDASDIARFESEVVSAKRAGATVLRTAMLGGRRYETFKTAAAFRRYSEKSVRSLELAKPIVQRHEMRLAVENHKDWRLTELVGVLERLNSSAIGACVDTGNSIALLDDPIEVVERLAPFAYSTHLKDMGVEEYADGFLLAEVPLGQGFLDLPRIVRTLRNARREIRFSLEMITRDPLKIPCLTESYWVTFPELPARDLARTLAMVRSHASKQPLPRISRLSPEEQIAAEDQNVRLCVTYARDRLGL